MSDKKSWMVPGAHVGADPEFFSAWTLYDIGPESENSRENLATLMNVVASRGQPLLAGIECIDSQDIGKELFGENFTGNQRVWCFKWIASAMGQMTESTLAVEANGLHMNIGLNETAKLSGKVCTSGSDSDTFFIRHESF
jgi:hypothetical protein